MITKDSFVAGCRCLIDNGIEPDEAQVVMQALAYVMFDFETEEFMVDDIPCCQSCANDKCHAPQYYDKNTIHDDCTGFMPRKEFYKCLKTKE